MLDDILLTLAREPATSFDLAEIALLLARDEFPKLDVDAHLAEIAAMAHEARHFVRDPSPVEKVKGLCRYLFHEMGFHGNRDNYYDPLNSYLNIVLERRTGIPITLSVVTIAVGRRVGLPLVGVGLPGHFVVMHDADREILIDPFHGGRLLTPSDCENVVRQVTGMNFDANELVLQELPTGLVIKRMLNNLKSIYLQSQAWARATRVLLRLRQLAPEEIVLRRELGMCYVQLDQPGKAIDHLQAYLQEASEAADASQVAAMLQWATKRIAENN